MARQSLLKRILRAAVSAAILHSSAGPAFSAALIAASPAANAPAGIAPVSGPASFSGIDGAAKLAGGSLSPLWVSPRPLLIPPQACLKARPAALRTARAHLRSAAVSAREAARPGTSAQAGAGTLLRIFHGSRPAGGPLAVAGVESSNKPALLAASASSSRQALPPAPRSSLSRSLKFGWLVGAGSAALSLIQPFAEWLGYVSRSNYDLSFLEKMAPGEFVFTTTILAPITEEIIFRSLAIGLPVYLLSKFAPNHKKSIAVGVSLAASVLFTVIHETSDPLLIALRMVMAFGFAWTYLREGLTSSMAAHAANNGLLALTLLVKPHALALNPLGLAAAAASIIAGAAAVYRSWKDIRKERADRREGLISRYDITLDDALAMSWILMLGSAFLFPKALLIASAFGFLIPNAVEIRDKRLRGQAKDPVGRRLNLALTLNLAVLLFLKQSAPQWGIPYFMLASLLLCGTHVWARTRARSRAV
jgi:membrane protease YdiL (CAAX protease family)